MLASGQNLAQRMRVEHQTPLMYEWYQEQYVGAAHGLSGIYYYLMQVKSTARHIILQKSYLFLIYYVMGEKSCSLCLPVARFHL